MAAILLNDAKNIAEQYLKKLEHEDGIPLVLVECETIAKHFGWVFFYNSKEYLETGNFRSMLLGNAPFIVDNNTGAIRITGTSKPIDEYIAEYERKLAS